MTDNYLFYGRILFIVGFAIWIHRQTDQLWLALGLHRWFRRQHLRRALRRAAFRSYRATFHSSH